MTSKEKARGKAKTKNAPLVGSVIRVWASDNTGDPSNAITASGGIARVTTQHVEIVTVTGRSILIQLRSHTHTYLLREADKIRVRIPNLIQKYQLPNLNDEILASTSARVAGILFPEKSSRSAAQQLDTDQSDMMMTDTAPEPIFEIITKYNAVVTDSIMKRYTELQLGKRRQVTLKLLGERLELMPLTDHLMYLSAVLTDVRLVELWQRKQLYCMPCETCGEVVFGNHLVGACPREECGKAVEMRINPQVIGGLTDETGTLGQGHGLLVADGIWEKLLAGGNSIGDGSCLSEKWIREREHLMIYERFTFVLLYLSKWGGGRLVLVDLLE